MILDGLFLLLADFLSFVLNLFPVWSSPSVYTATCDDPATGTTLTNLGCPAYTVGGYVHYLHRWIDVETLATVLGIVLTVWLATIALKGILFLYSKIPGKAT